MWFLTSKPASLEQIWRAHVSVGYNVSKIALSSTHTQTQGSLKMNSREGVLVSKMVNQGEGVWVSYKGSSSLELFHTTSKTSLQNIDIKSTLSSIIKSELLRGAHTRSLNRGTLSSHYLRWQSSVCLISYS